MITRSFTLERVRLPALVGLLVVAFTFRAYSLHWPPLAWDEGWSLAISQLPFADIAYLTSRDVHPPGYYLALRPFLSLGRSEFVIRYLSLLAGVLAVPLAYQLGRVWVGRRAPAAMRVGLLTAVFVAVSPLLIYYSQVARMYALTVLGVLLAAWGMLRCLDTEQPAPPAALAAWVIGALLAVYTFYYSALALGALGLYAVFASRPLWRTPHGRWAIVRILVATAIIAAAFWPWLGYAREATLERIDTRGGTLNPAFELAQVLGAALYGMVFAYGPGWLAVWILAGVVVVGAALTLRRRTPDQGLSPWRLLLPVLAVAVTLLGVALGTRAHMFAARYTIAAAPFVALAVAYSLAALAAWPRVAFGTTVLALLVTLWPMAVGHVYAKDLERSGAFEPWADAQALRAAGARPDDLVIFNILSLAGAYDAYRDSDLPPWTYAQRWDPVAEWLKRIEDRLKVATAGPPRVWTLLYQGTAGPNEPIKVWLDRNLYPTTAAWRGDTLTLLHLATVEPRRSVAPTARWAAGPVLVDAAFTTETRPGGGVTVDLEWRTSRPAPDDYNVFVHLYDTTGRLVAQHDGAPQGGAQPTTGWPTDRSVFDFHGLIVPTGVHGPLTLRVGLYNPASGQRLPLMDGSDMADLGTVSIVE